MFLNINSPPSPSLQWNCCQSHTRPCHIKRSLLPSLSDSIRSAAPCAASSSTSAQRPGPTARKPWRKPGETREMRRGWNSWRKTLEKRVVDLMLIPSLTIRIWYMDFKHNYFMGYAFYTLYTPHFAFHILHSTLQMLHSTLYTLHFTLCTVPSHSTLYTWHFTLHNVHSTIYTLHFAHFAPCMFTKETCTKLFKHSFFIIMFYVNVFRHLCLPSGSWAASCFLL